MKKNVNSLVEAYKNKANYLLETDEELMEKFDVAHMRCPHCKLDLVKHSNAIEVPSEKGKTKVGLDVSSCPKCGFVGDIDIQ
ncbi:MAG: hypothetical protein PHF86_13480 [Candidatus Nanoarchaeia archaeon]|nr:hypothetical protein [Candidatus Nanoarchaeia archaeon]